MQEIAEFASGNVWLVSGLVASGLAVLFYELRLKARNIGSLGTSVAVQLINKGSRVIDLRDPDKFAAGHIVDAKNMPADGLQDNTGQLQSGQKSTLLVCETGDRSAEVAGNLRKSGTENVYSLAGGIEAWRRENLPLITDDK